jgi:hypothetical protein
MLFEEYECSAMHQKLHFHQKLQNEMGFTSDQSQSFS